MLKLKTEIQMKTRKVYYAIHSDGEPVRYTACHSVVTYDTEQEAQSDNHDSLIKCTESFKNDCGDWTLEVSNA